MRREPNYLYVLIALLTGVVLVTAGMPLGLIAFVGGLFAIVSLLVTAYGLLKLWRHLLLTIVLGIAALLPIIWFSVHPDALSSRMANSVYVVNIVLWVAFTCYITVIVFRGIIKAQRIRRNEVYGAIYVYILIGVIFAALYQLLLAWQPNTLHFEPGRFQEPQLLVGSLYTRGAGAVLYYSFVTLGTVGYGDVTPASSLARSLSLIEAIIGIVYVATMIARFVSIQIGSERTEGKLSQ
jgi:hypothetical protein